MLIKLINLSKDDFQKEVIIFKPNNYKQNAA